VYPWNKGLTKETDQRIVEYSDKVRSAILSKNLGFQKGYIPWNKGREMSEGCINKRTKSYKSTRFSNKLEKIRKYEKGGIVIRMCECGCQEFTRNRFLHGHNYFNAKTKLFWSEKNQKQIYYQSSYELASFELLEKMGIVKSYERCPYIIDYRFEEKIHKYIPDILITYDDGRQEVIEIKPTFRLIDERNKSKFSSAIFYFEQKEIDFSIWTEKELNLRRKNGRPF
jgi:hypothetical protein